MSDAQAGDEDLECAAGAPSVQDVLAIIESTMRPLMPADATPEMHRLFDAFGHIWAMELAAYLEKRPLAGEVRRELIRQLFFPPLPT
jgi:hypothetical protein